jgi:hypothetical protein
VISQRWKHLPEYGKEFYRDVARTDQERYEVYLESLRQRQPSSGAEPV